MDRKRAVMLAAGSVVVGAVFFLHLNLLNRQQKKKVRSAWTESWISHRGGGRRGSYSSVLIIVAFSTERYLAVCHPFITYQISTLRRAKIIISCCWGISLFFALPFAHFSWVNYLDWPPDSGKIIEKTAFCALLYENLPKDTPFGILYELSFGIMFVIPVTVIAVMYWKMMIKLKERESETLRRPSTNSNQRTRKGIIRMLGAVVVAFFISWAPFHVQRLVYVHMRHSDYYQEVNEWLYYVAGIFYYLTSTVNPILYSCMSIKFRNAFKVALGLEKPADSQIPRDGVIYRNTTARVADRNGNTTVGLIEGEKDSALTSLKPRQKETYI